MPRLAAILALTGDPAGYDDARCLVKLASTNPTERSSGEREAAGGIHRRGRPILRYVAYQAAVCLVRHEPEFQRRYHELTDKRRAHRLSAKQAYVASPTSSHRLRGEQRSGHPRPSDLPLASLARWRRASTQPSADASKREA